MDNFKKFHNWQQSRNGKSLKLQYIQNVFYFLTTYSLGKWIDRNQIASNPCRMIVKKRNKYEGTERNVLRSWLGKKYLREYFFLGIQALKSIELQIIQLLATSTQ